MPNFRKFPMAAVSIVLRGNFLAPGKNRQAVARVLTYGQR